MLYDYHIPNTISITYYSTYIEFLPFARHQVPDISFHPCTNLGLYLLIELL